MKKIFVVLLTCILIVGGVYIGVTNPSIKAIFATEPEYLDNNFVINDLQLSDSTYFYNNLSDPQKQIYTAIAKSVKKLETRVTIPNYVEENNSFNDNVNIAMEAFLADHPEVFYINPKYEISNVSILMFKGRYINLSYSVLDDNELDDKLKQMKEAINDIVKLTEGKSDFEKEVIIHDILGERISYDYDKELVEESHTAYGALIKNKAVCDGMAKAMQLVLNKVGITSYFATGDTENGAHAWNIVKLDNEYYHLDLTSNKSIKEENKNIIVHSYFNITDDLIKETHEISDKYVLPKCTATKYDYYNQKDFIINEEDNFDFELKRIITASQDKKVVEFRPISISNAEKQIARVYSNITTSRNNLTQNKLYYYTILNTYVIVNK